MPIDEITDIATQIPITEPIKLFFPFAIPISFPFYKITNLVQPFYIFYSN